MTVYDRSVLELHRLAPEPYQRRNYLKLRRLLPDLDQIPEGGHLRLVAGGREPIEVIGQFREDERLLLNFGHFVERCGEVVPNPALYLIVDLAFATVDPLAYQDPDLSIDRLARDSEAVALGDYLSLWLSNLHEQGYTAAS